MKYRIELSRIAMKYLKSLDKKPYSQIYNHMKILSENPRHPELDIKKLHGKSNLYRLRIRDYRVLYTINDEILLIIVVKIGSRGGIYK
jgi:mRNA interferase RelE/StbE